MIKRRYEICADTAANLREAIQSEIAADGKLSKESAKTWRDMARRDAGYHLIFGFSFFKDARGRNVKQWSRIKVIDKFS